MARDKVSIDEVSAAADKILAAGGKVTITSLYEQLKADTGRAGSYSVLGPLLNEWRAQAKPSASEPIEVSVPDAIRDRVTDMSASLWMAAMEIANGKLAEERAAFDLRIAKLEAEKDEAYKAADDAQEAAQQALERITALEQENKDLADKVADLENQNREHVVIARNAATQIDTLTKERDAATEKHTELINERAQLKHAFEASRQTVDQLARDCKKQAEELKQSQMSLHACTARLETAEREVTQLREQLKDCRAEAKAANNDASTLRGKLEILLEQAKDKQNKTTK